MKKVIVTDVKYRMALSPVRELSKKGYSVTAVEFEDVPVNERIGFYSKYVSNKAVIRSEDSAFCEDIEKLCTDERPVLLPVNRKSLETVIKNRDFLNKMCDFLVPSEKAIQIADDKNIICSIAKGVGVPIPSTTSLREHESVEKMADSIKYPCIIKFRNGEAMGKKPAERYTITNNREEFIKAYKKMHEENEFPIASDYIKGRDIGVAVVMNRNHKPVSFLCYESLREYPVQGGPTCFLRTVFDRQLLKYACKILEEIEFTGIAMLDFKGTLEHPFFLEINPRVWGSAMVTEVSKSPFFESYVKASCGNDESLDIDTCEPQYIVGRKMRFTPQSFACFAANLKYADNKALILKQYVKSFFDFTVCDGLFTLDDYKPYTKYMLNLLKRS